MLFCVPKTRRSVVLICKEFFIIIHCSKKFWALWTSEQIFETGKYRFYSSDISSLRLGRDSLPFNYFDEIALISINICIAFFFMSFVNSRKRFKLIIYMFDCISGLSGGHSVLTTPTRVSAMNIVGDLLRKVGVSIWSLS